MNWISESCATLIRMTPSFRGKARIVQWWMGNCRKRGIRPRTIGFSRLLCDLVVPYEAMVWLRQEEEDDLHILQSLLEPKGLFIDVGANIGLWSTVAAEAVGGDQVIAFEPNPTTYQKLFENTQGGGAASKITIFPFALGASDGEITLHCAEDHNVSSVLPIAVSNRTRQVPLRHLDSFLSEWPKVQGMKVDAEGFELAVLTGAEKLLRRDSPWLIIEFNTELAGTMTLGQWDVHQYLSSLGYGATTIDRVGKVGRDSPDAFLPRSWSTAGYCNLYYQRSPL